MIQTWAFQLAEECAGYLDHLRSGILRLTMRVQWLRPFFYVRSLRLLTLFALSCAAILSVSLLFPLWALLLGPLIYGVPHILSSVRYFHHASAVLPDAAQAGRKRLAFALAGVVLLLVFGYRLFITANIAGLEMPQISEWKGSTYVELLALGVAYIGAAIIYRRSPNQFLRGLLLLLPFAALFVKYPLLTIGAMVLIHNFVAFVYWIAFSKTRAESQVAWACFGVLLLVTGIIFTGGLDWALRLGSPRLALDFAGLSVEDTGRMILPGTDNELLWLRAAVAFAFGQGLHYFAWLKAIPDQAHHHDVPTSFRQSLRLLEEDFGRVGGMLLVYLSVGVLGLWFLLSFQRARLVYFCLASFHGYLEIAGLGLLLSRGFRSGKQDKTLRSRSTLRLRSVLSGNSDIKIPLGGG